jgi:hypothetical protein
LPAVLGSRWLSFPRSFASFCTSMGSIGTSESNASVLQHANHRHADRKSRCCFVRIHPSSTIPQRSMHRARGWSACSRSWPPIQSPIQPPMQPPSSHNAI